MTDRNSNNQCGSVREAEISKANGQTYGICIYVTTDELQAMGIGLDGEETLQYRVGSTAVEIYESNSTTR